MHNNTAEDPDMAALILQHQKAVRQAKKTTADAFLAEVDAAINAGDQFVAYKVLKQLLLRTRRCGSLALASETL